MSSQYILKITEGMNEIRTLIKIVNDKFDALSEYAQNNVYHQPPIVSNNDPTRQQTLESDQESVEQFSDTVSENSSENDIQTSEEEETTETSDCESESDYEPSQISEQSSSQFTDKANNNKKKPLLDWQKQCLQILDKLWKCKYSEDFRYSVDPCKFPNYRKLITCPMDLYSVKEQLDAGNYKCLMDFEKDMSLIFENSKKFTPDKNNKIYKKTIKMENRYKKLIDPIIFENKRNSPTKRKINVIESDEDSDSPTEKPKRYKRIKNFDEPGTSNDCGIVGTLKEKTKKTSPRKKRKISVHSQQLSSSEDLTENESMSETAEDTKNTSDFESINYEENCSWMDSNDIEKERYEKIAKTIPLSESKIVETMVHDEFINLTGRVLEKRCKEDLYSISQKKHHNLFEFLIEIDDGKKIYCCAWNNQASKYKKEMITNQIILIENGRVRSATKYNQGNIDFEITIYNNTKITDVVNNKIIGEEEVCKAHICIPSIYSQYIPSFFRRKRLARLPLTNKDSESLN